MHLHLLPRTRGSLTTLAGLALGLPTAALAGLVAYEDFSEYNVGWELHQLSNTQVGWVGAWADGGSGILRATVVEGSLTYAPLGWTGGGNHCNSTSWDAGRSYDGGAFDVDGDFEVDDGTVLWYSNLFKLDLPFPGQRILWFSSSGGSSKLGFGYEIRAPQVLEGPDAGQVITVYDPVRQMDVPSEARLFISLPKGDLDSLSQPALSERYLTLTLNQTYLVVGKVVFGQGENSDSHYLWLNPANATSEATLGAPSLMVTGQTFPTVADFVTSTLYMRGASIAFPLWMDEFRLGTALSDVSAPGAAPGAFAADKSGLFWDPGLGLWKTGWDAYVVSESAYPWLWHPQFGWIYEFPGGSGDAFYYRIDTSNWLYVNPWWFPFVYDFSAGLYTTVWANYYYPPTTDICYNCGGATPPPAP